MLPIVVNEKIVMLCKGKFSLVRGHFSQELEIMGHTKHALCDGHIATSSQNGVSWPILPRTEALAGECLLIKCHAISEAMDSAG
jgi:hypothetical protein